MKSTRGRVTLPMEHLLRAARMVGVTRGEWAISLADDATMTRMHDQFLGIAETTDVLTFDLGTNAKTRGVETRREIFLDTLICVDEAKRRAREMGHAVGRELLLYAVHSLLHVVGYDDVTPTGAKKMHRREDEILTALGAGPVYAGSRARANGRKGAGK